MPDPGDPFVPEQREAYQRPARDVNADDVVSMLTLVLHRQACDGRCDDDPDVAVTDLEARAADARRIHDKLRKRGWKVVNNG